MNRNFYNRYSRNLKGFNGLGFFTNAAAYPSDATIVAFQASGTEGEVGIFLDTNALKTTALTSAQAFYVAQKNSDGDLKKSQIIPFADVVDVRRANYTAPKKQISFVGSNGTTGSLNITFPSTLSEYGIRVNDLSTANQPFPVQEGRAVVEKSNADIYDDVVRPIVNDLNNVPDYEGNSDDEFVIADVVSDVAGDAVVAAASYTFQKGSNIVLTSADTTANWAVTNFLGVVPTGLTVQSKFKVVAKAATHLTLDRPWPHASQTTAQTGVFESDLATTIAGDFGIRLVSAAPTIFFSVGLVDRLSLAGSDKSTSVDWVQGTGASWQVHFMEEEAAIFDGETTINAQFKEDYGQVDRYVPFNGSETYDIYYIKYKKQVQSSAAPIEQTTHYGYLFIAVANDTPGTPGGTVATALNTIFGL